MADQIHHRAAPLPLPELQRAEYRRGAVTAQGFGEDLREDGVTVAREFPALRRERPDHAGERRDRLVEPGALPQAQHRGVHREGFRPWVIRDDDGGHDVLRRRDLASRGGQPGDVLAHLQGEHRRGSVVFGVAVLGQAGDPVAERARVGRLQGRGVRRGPLR